MRKLRSIEFAVGVLIVIFCFANTALQSTPAFSQDLPESFDHRMDDWPLDLKIEGVVIVSGGGPVSADIVKRFSTFAGGDDANIVALNLDPKFEAKDFKDRFSDVDEVEVFYLPRSGAAPQLEEVEKKLDAATGVWFHAELRPTRAQRRALLKMKSSLQSLLQRKGVIYLSSPVASFAGKHKILGRTMGGDEIKTAEGLNLFFDAIVLPEFGEKASGLLQKRWNFTHEWLESESMLKRILFCRGARFGHWAKARPIFD